MGLKIFRGLTACIKGISHNIKEFKPLLKNFLYSNSFYTLEIYFDTRTHRSVGSQLCITTLCILIMFIIVILL
jgi:hypothetical protein